MPNVRLSIQGKDFLTQINALRAEQGTAPLIINDTLQQVAIFKANNMKQYQYLSHTWWDIKTQSWRPDWEIAKMFGWPIQEGTINFGEVLCIARKADAAIAEFKYSAQHWMALMEPHWQYAGVSQAGGYWSVTLGN